MKKFLTFAECLLIISSFLAVYLYATRALADDVKETRVRIGIIDTGVAPGHEAWYCKDARPRDFTGYGINDQQGHGTNIAGLIAKSLDIKNYCFVIAKFYNKDEGYASVGEALHWMARQNVRYLNMSFYGKGRSSYEKEMITKMLHDDTRVIVAAGNDGIDLDEKCTSFPACIYAGSTRDNFYVVASFNWAGSNHGGPVNGVEYGVNRSAWGTRLFTGTSQATAVFTGRLAKDLR